MAHVRRFLGAALVQAGHAAVARCQARAHIAALALSIASSAPLLATQTIQGTQIGGLNLSGPPTQVGGPSCSQLDWLPTFGERPGVTGAVLALTEFDDGAGQALYVAGAINSAGGQPVGKIARWRNGEFSALGSGLNGDVQALTVFDDGAGPALYAAGEFTTAGGQSANRIARWDGASWSALGSGFDNSVLALAVFDDGSGPALYAGGAFTTAGGQPARKIAKWDGASWSTLGGGSDWIVRALAAVDHGAGGGSALYASGSFTSAGGQPISYIGRWDGASWSALGSGVNNDVRKLGVFDDGSGPKLCVAGALSSAGGQPASRVASWDGASWSALGSGVTGDVSAFAAFDSGSGPELYATGYFTNSSGFSDMGVARWNGASWVMFGSEVWNSSGTASPVGNALAVADDGTGGGPALYLGGSFDYVRVTPASNIARWDGAEWTSLGTALNNSVVAVATYDDGTGGGPALYAGGDFTGAGGQPARGLARWDGASWSAPLGGVYNNEVWSLTVFDDGAGPALYAGGLIGSPVLQPAQSIARFDGVSWSALGDGVNTPPSCMTGFDDGSGPALYACGSFIYSGDLIVNRIARWDGTSWSTLGSGLDATADAMVVFDDGAGGGPALYVGGAFTSASGQSASRIARWNGVSWSPLGSGLNDRVFALAVFDDGAGPALYAGGRFTTAGGQPANRIARWNGASWSSVGSGVNDHVRALTVFDEGSGLALYATGRFTSAGALPANRIARWDGASWSALGTGLGDLGRALTVYDDGAQSTLVVGGHFSTSPAGDQFIARWGCADSPLPISMGGGSNTTPSAPIAPHARIVRRGEVLELGAERQSYTTLRVESGAVLRLANPDAWLNVRELAVESGARIDWLAGAIRVVGGTLSVDESLWIGDRGPARLLLESGARVRAPVIELCSQGSLEGAGVIEAIVLHSGLLQPRGHGLEIRGELHQLPQGATLIEAPARESARRRAPIRVRGLVSLAGKVALRGSSSPSGVSNGPIAILEAEHIAGAFERRRTPAWPAGSRELRASHRDLQRLSLIALDN